MTDRSTDRTDWDRMNDEARENERDAQADAFLRDAALHEPAALGRPLDAAERAAVEALNGTVRALARARAELERGIAATPTDRRALAVVTCASMAARLDAIAEAMIETAAPFWQAIADIRG